MVAKEVDDKGLIVDSVVKDIARVIHKSDKEPAIVKVLRESLKALKVEGLDHAREEHSPFQDSQANGGIEVGVKLV